MRDGLRGGKAGAVVLFGLPGSGKGTQAIRLAEFFGIPAISTGEMLRREIRSGTKLGQTVSGLMERGVLVGDQLVNEMICSRLGEPDCVNGFVLDGYPRTVSQARFLDKCLKALHFPHPSVVFFDVAAEVVASRMLSRLECPLCNRTYVANGAANPTCEADGSALVHRADDNPESIWERLRQYQANTEPVLDYYAATLARVDAADSPDAVFHRLCEAVAGKGKTGTPSRRNAVALA